MKQQVRRRLARDFVEFKKQQAILATVWALYKKAEAVLKLGKPRANTVWVCRPCQKLFRSKGGLGAHFFKAHGRKARYRAVVKGTMCRACGTQYWDPNRLSRHLRDSPDCVNTLRSYGLYAEEVAPGMGSRGWRKNATACFHPAVPARTDPALEPRDDGNLDDVPKQAYRAVCEKLLSAMLPSAVDAVILHLKRVIDDYPLYADEITELLTIVAGEVCAVQDELLGDYWSAEQLKAATDAVAMLLATDWASDGIPAAEEPLSASFGEIAVEVENIDWDALWCATRRKHVTPSREVVELSDDWEAELFDKLRTLDVSAVHNHLWDVVPSGLKKVWLLVLDGHEPALIAQQPFWTLQLAVPFRHLCHSKLHPN